MRKHILGLKALPDSTPDKKEALEELQVFLDDLVSGLDACDKANYAELINKEIRHD